jgi:hypothetical protein
MWGEEMGGIVCVKFSENRDGSGAKSWSRVENGCSKELKRGAGRSTSNKDNKKCEKQHRR